MCGGVEDEILALAHTGAHGFVFDPRGRLSQAPLWVHALARCLDGALVHAEEIGSGLGIADEAARRDLADLRRAVCAQLEDQARQCLAQCAAAGIVVGGHDALIRALENDEVALLVAAIDAAPRTLRSISRANRHDLPFHRLGLDRDALGARVGQPARAVVGIPGCSASAPLLRHVERLRVVRAEATPEGLG